MRSHSHPPPLPQPISSNPITSTIPSVNVEALAQAESTEAKDVLKRMDGRRGEKLLALQGEAEAGMFPDPSFHRHYRHHNPNGHHQQRHQHHRRRTSSASLPPTEPSPLKQAQLLRQRKEQAAAVQAAGSVGGVSLSATEGAKGGGDDGLAGPEVEEGEGGGRGGRGGSPGSAARSAALLAAAGGVADRSSRNDSCSDWTRWVLVRYRKFLSYWLRKFLDGKTRLVHKLLVPSSQHTKKT